VIQARCGNDPRARPTEADLAVVAQYAEFLEALARERPGEAYGMVYGCRISPSAEGWDSHDD
jgi:hypothetical protein